MAGEIRRKNFKVSHPVCPGRHLCPPPRSGHGKILMSPPVVCPERHLCPPRSVHGKTLMSPPVVCPERHITTGVKLVWKIWFRVQYFFNFFWFFYWGMLALPRGNNKAAFRSETHLKSDDSDQKQGFQLIANAGPLKQKLWLTEDHDVSCGKLSKFIHWVRNMNKGVW